MGIEKLVRLLYLCQRIPFPPDRGDRILVYHHIQGLSRNHEVVVGSLNHPGSQRNAEELKKELGISLIAPNHSVIRRAIGMAASLLKGKPLSLGYFHNPELRDRLDREIAQKQFDAIMVFSSSMAQYVEHHRQISRIMYFCDVDSRKWEELAERSNRVMKWIYIREHRMLLKYERKIAAEFSASCVVSNSEADLFKKCVSGIPVNVIENGVDVDYFSAVPRCAKDPRIVFVGVMDYDPNVEAVSFFAERVWRKICDVYPKAQFLIVGSNPNRKVLNLARIGGVKVTGYVPDVRPYLASATLTVAPLAVARGVQNKILEAMAAGVPVLTTPCVIEGLPAGAEHHVFVAERESEPFGSALLKLMGNPLALEEKAASAKEFVRQHCTWEAKLQTLDELVKKVMSKKSLQQNSQIRSKQT